MRRHSRRRVVLGAVAAVGLAAIAWVALGRGQDEGSTAADEPATATAEVERRDLKRTESFDGTLGYSGERTVINQAAGTITSLRDEGDVVKRGNALYRVDGVPVLLFYGETPQYRALAENVSNGTDVRQLEQNLRRLGYDTGKEMKIDREFDSATTAAVERWQEDRGLEVDGVVDFGEIVFLPGQRRIGEIRTSVGQRGPPGGEVMTTTTATQQVTVNLDATKQTLVAKGDVVQVEFPDNRDVDGRITQVGKVATAEVSSDGTAGDPTIGVNIALSERSDVLLDQAPVDVQITTDSRDNVLAVPVEALLALKGGGYALELEEGSTTRLVAVETGFFADGYVEVTGDEISEGTKIQVPA